MRAPSVPARRTGVLAAAVALFVADVAAVLSGALAGTHPVRGASGVATAPVATAPATTTVPPRPRATAPGAVTSTTSAGSTGAGRGYTGGGSGPGVAGAYGARLAAASSASGGCQASVCVTLDGTSSLGPVNHAAAGVIALATQDGDGSRLRELATSMFRSSPGLTGAGTLDWTTWDAGVSAGAQTTLILSNLWWAKYNGHPVTPWSNWNNYVGWVRSTVLQVMGSGRRVDYWDIYNEPGWNTFYSPSDYQSETPGDLLQQFLVTYQAIKGLDPGAAIVGPSIGDLVFSPLPANDPVTHEPDMTTFLDFAAQHGLQLAAVSWHDNQLTPAAIQADAARVWALIRARPALGQPQMFLDEYGDRTKQPIPGWDVGYMSAIANAGIGSGVRSCWDGCELATVDGLLLDGGATTTGEYFDRLTYARMSGQMLRTASTSGGVPALGSIDPSSHQLVALVGRMDGCAVESWCRSHWWAHPVPAAPESVQVTVILPWATPNVRVNLSYEPFQPDSGLAGPIPVTPAQAVLTPDGGGTETLTFTIPAFADGSAYNLTVTQA